MSNNERIRLVRLSKSLEKHALLSRLSLVVYDGEALGGFGFSAYEKDALRRILLGKYAYDGGCIFWDEKLSRDNPLLPGRYIAWIGGNTSLIEDASVAENLFVFKAGRNFFSIVNWGSVLKQAQINLDDMGLSISARTPVSKLNCLEHRIVEIIRASLQGARLIVIDETIGALGENAYGILGDVLKRLKQRGISFLIFDAHISTLEQLTDRLVIQSHGCVLNFSRDSFRHGMAIQEQMIDAAIKSRSSLAEREIVFRADRLPIDLGHCVSFDLHKGEMIEIYDAGRGFNDMLIKNL